MTRTFEPPSRSLACILPLRPAKPDGGVHPTNSTSTVRWHAPQWKSSSTGVLARQGSIGRPGLRALLALVTIFIAPTLPGGVGVAQAQVASADASLSALSLRDGILQTPPIYIELTPTFHTDTTSYVSTVANSMAFAAVSATPSHASATVQYLDGSDQTLTDAYPAIHGLQVALAEGANTIKVKVTAEDANTTRTYVVAVTREAAEAAEGVFDAPENLTATPGDGWISLTWTPHSPGMDELGNVSHGRVLWHEYRQETAGAWSGWTRTTNSHGPSGGSDGGHGSSFLLVPNLTNGVAYSFQVRARNVAGYSWPSSVVSATPAGVEPTPTLTIEGVPGKGAALQGVGDCQTGRTAMWFRIRAAGADHLWHREGSQGISVNLDSDLGDGYNGLVDSKVGLVPLNATSNADGNRYWDLRNCFSKTGSSTNVGVRLLDGSEYVVGGQSEVTIDASYQASMSVGDATAHEDNDPTADFVVTLQPAQSTTVTVQYATSDGTATAGADYTSDSGTLTFAPGVTEQTITITVLDDTVPDNGETFKLTLSNPSTGVYLERDQATGTIRNADYLVSVADASGNENDYMQFVVSINEEVREGFVEVFYATSDITATAGEDYRARSISHTWAVHFWPGRGTEQVIKIWTWPDKVEDSGETFMLTVRPSTNGRSRTVQIENPEAIGTILEPGAEPPPSSLSVADAEASEGETLHFVVTLDPVASETVTVDYATSNGTATAGNDYTSKSGTLTFQAGEIEKTVSVPITDDTTDDDGETLTLTLSNPSGAEVADATATGTIVAAPTLAAELSVADAQATEGENATLDFVVTLNPAASDTVTVDYATSDGTATAGDDYTDTSGTLTFAAGETEKTVSVPITDDTVADDGETLTLTLSGASGAEVSYAKATGTIRNPELSVGDAEATEGDDTTLDFVVTLDPAAGETVTVDYATSDGTATAGDDYTDTSGTLTFAAGETEKTVSVPITDDTVADDGETLTLTLSNAAGGDLDDAEATGTIRDSALACGAHDAGEDLLGVGALAGAVAAAHLADDDGGPDGLFGAPVGGVDRRVPQEGEEGGEFDGQVRGEALGVVQRRRVVDQPADLGEQSAAGGGQTVFAQFAGVAPVTQREAGLQGVLHLTDPPAVGMILQQMLTPSK